MIGLVTGGVEHYSYALSSQKAVVDIYNVDSDGLHWCYQGSPPSRHG